MKTKHHHRLLMSVTKVVCSILMVAVVIVVVVYLWPLRSASLENAAADSMTYAQAVTAAQAQREADTKAGVIPGCASTLYTHGAPTAQAVVMFHGVGACPSQMEGLATYFYQHGFNVYVARWPWHGLPDARLHGNVTAQELVATTNEAINIGSGLGAQVGVAGLSGGGVMATWAAEYRPDTVRRLLVMSPFYMPSATEAPIWERKPLAVLYGYGILPDTFTAGSAGSLSYHALAQFVRITDNLTTAPTNPRLASVGVAVSSTDTSIDHLLAQSIPQALAKANGSMFHLWTSPPSWDLGHDIVADGDNPDLKGHSAQVYPIYFQLYEGQ